MNLWKVGVADSRFPGASFTEGSTINPISELSSSGALPFYMTLARFTETTVLSEESGRSVTSEAAAAAANVTGAPRGCSLPACPFRRHRARSSVKKKPPLE
ncbi:unnamed protein product [Pieris brassicae]|uniref:Uncharacterized protein n=1 Tax=Pieris brassicae TaxID=7116 RepID=A0A9P0X4L9_PIEBR|nr:unnamed protein product [Pieris brassicae]